MSPAYIPKRTVLDWSDRFGRIAGRGGECFEYKAVHVRFLLILDRQDALQLLARHNIGMDRFTRRSELKDRESWPNHRVLGVQKQDLDCDVGPIGQLRQPFELTVHHRSVADPALEDRLVEHDSQLDERLTNQDLLAP
jgi:hypothetical protein